MTSSRRRFLAGLFATVAVPMPVPKPERYRFTVVGRDACGNLVSEELSAGPADFTTSGIRFRIVDRIIVGGFASVGT